MIATKVTESQNPAVFLKIITCMLMAFLFQESAQKHKIEWILAITCNFYLTL